RLTGEARIAPPTNAVAAFAGEQDACRHRVYVIRSAHAVFADMGWSPGSSPVGIGGAVAPGLRRARLPPRGGGPPASPEVLDRGSCSRGWTRRAAGLAFGLPLFDDRVAARIRHG